MFRGKESSNRIKISRLVQDLLNFGVMGSLQLWGGGRYVGGIWEYPGAWGGVTTCTHMHTHAHKCMYRNCKWPLTWRHPCLSCLTCMCMCACMYVCMGHPYTPIPDPTPIHPSATPQGGTCRIGQHSITLELIKIFQFCLKI